jgi:hypothetical protein
MRNRTGLGCRILGAVSARREATGPTRTAAAWRIVGALLAVTCLSCVTSASAGATSYVDGISDQNFMNWAGNYSDASGYNTPFPGFFADSWVGNPASHIKLGRYVVQWNVMKGAGYSGELANLESWYSHVTELHMTPEVALDNYNCSGCSVPKTTEEYTKALEALHSAFPGISVVEAWNEPNNEHYTSHVTPVAAAHFMNAAYSFCASHGCTAVAGDLLDSESNMVTYEGEYESNLNPRDPGNWGIHPYHAVKYESSATVTNYLNALPSPTTDHVWFTEVGAYYCELGTSYGPSSQEKNAKYLVSHLIPEFAPSHVFYYTAAWHYDEKPPCNSGTEDTALYAAESTGGPVLARPAAKVIFGPEGAPSATTGSSSGLQPLQATVSGSINPQGLDDAEYYFEYGTSTSYGSSTSRGNAGPGLNSVGESATITSLKPGTTYHFRIVATSTAGTTPGSDQTFQTPGPVEAVTTTATGVQQTEAVLNGTVDPRGYDAKYYFEYGETAAYGASTSEGDAGAGPTPEPQKVVVTGLTPGTIYHYRLVSTSGGVVSYGHDVSLSTLSAEYVFYRGTNGGLQNGYWTGSTWEFAPIGSAGTVEGNPSVIISSEGHTLGRGIIDVFYRGTSGGLQNWYWSGSAWSYSPIGPEHVMAGDPHAIALPGGHIDVFYRATNGQLQNWYWTGSAWTYSPLGSENAVASEPSAVALPGSHIDVFYRAPNGQLQNWYWSGAAWSYGPIGAENVVAGNPSAVALTESHIDVFYRATNGQLQNWYWTGSAWTYSPLGSENAVAGNPSAVALPEGHIDVFYRATDNGLQNWYWSSPTWYYDPLGSEGTLVGDPDAVAWPNGNMDVFYRGPKEVLENWFWSSPSWSFGSLGSEKSIAGEPSAVAW